MSAEASIFSEAFRQLYCDAALFENFSVWHPIRFTRVLPFQAGDPVMEDPRLLAAEAAHLADPDEETRLAVMEAFGQCGLLSAEDVAALKPVADYYDADFFEFMGEVYANAGMFICALRWHREYIAELESRPQPVASDAADVYASVGYCLYSLGLYAEAAAWSRSCIGPRQTADTVCRALIHYEAQEQGGCLWNIDRVGSRTRYTATTSNPDQDQVIQITQRLKDGMAAFAPFQEVYLDWLKSDTPAPALPPEGYPFQAERDASGLTRHRLNLIFSLCGQADDLAARGFSAEAKRLLWEAALLEPQAEFVQERIRDVDGIRNLSSSSPSS